MINKLLKLKKQKRREEADNEQLLVTCARKIKRKDNKIKAFRTLV